MRRYLLLFAAATTLFVQSSVAGTTHAAVTLNAHAPPSLQPTSACTFQPPTPVFSPNTYPGQTFERQAGNQVTEKAQLPNGLRIEVRQRACVDFLTTEFTLLVPHDQGLHLDQNGWIELARTTIAGLTTHKPAAEYKDLNDFLSRAHSLRSRNDVLAACKDGSDARPGECSWESLGGFVFSVRRTGRGTRVSVTQYVSG